MEYRHAEQHADKLFERLQELREVDKPWQTEERRITIQHEIACIVFEQMVRYQETHKEMEPA